MKTKKNRFSKQKRPKTLQEEKNPLDADELARREAEKYNIHVYTPRNTDKVRITIKGQKIAKVSCNTFFFFLFLLSN